MLRNITNRWMALALAALLAAGGLSASGVAIDWASAQPYGLSVLALLAVAAGARYGLSPSVGGRLEDLALSVAQYVTILCIGLPLSYLAVAAGAGFPLLDDILARIDRQVFGFDWHAAVAWVEARPALHLVLDAAYVSYAPQVLVLLVLGSLMRPGHRNGEFLAAWMFAVALTLGCFVFTPAQSMVSVDNHQAVLHAIRDGHWSVFSWDPIIGLVTFPSFHTAAALIFVYAASLLGRATLMVFLPLNILMLLSVPTEGTHCLLDIAGGAVVACLAILLASRTPSRARQLRRARQAAAQSL